MKGFGVATFLVSFSIFSFLHSCVGAPAAPMRQEKTLSASEEFKAAIDGPNKEVGLVEGMPFNIAKPFYPLLNDKKNKFCPKGTAATVSDVEITCNSKTIGTADLVFGTVADGGCKVDLELVSHDQDVDVDGNTCEVCPAYKVERFITVSVTFDGDVTVGTNVYEKGSAEAKLFFKLQICGDFTVSFAKGFHFHLPKFCLNDVDVTTTKLVQKATKISLLTTASDPTSDVCTGCLNTPVTNCNADCNKVLKAIQDTVLDISDDFDEDALEKVLPLCIRDTL